MDYTLAALEAELPSAEMIRLVTEILASSLRSIGLFIDGIHRLADLPLGKPPESYYEQWLARSIRYLQEQDVLTDDLTFRRDVRPLTELWDIWAATVAVWASTPQRQAQSALLRACLEGLPGVLSGRQRATDVMFPNSSMHLVEGIYRGNPQADYFNDALGRTLSTCLEQRLQIEPGRRFRILEIGAGTGGTTAALLPIVQRYPVDEYCYTDISKAFLMHAEKHFQPQCPVLTTALFDVSRPLEPQSMASNRYDFAIAANVLHATPNIRETLRNAKAALKNEGVLLLNEVSTWALTNHLTFGLLEGWWLYEDEALRLPGSPGLSSETWREILTAEGFESIAFPAEEAHRFGQQIVAAASNGWTRQRIVRNVPQPRVESVEQQAPTRSDSRPTAPVERLAADHTRQIITATLSEALRLDAGAIRADASFADFGVDSIIGVNVVRTISEALQIELETTSLFEYSTVDDLTRHILTNWSDQVAAQVSQHQEAPSASTSTPEEMPAEHEHVGATRFADARSELDFDDAGEPGTAGIEPIAIIGMSGRFADAENLDTFWQYLAEGRDLVKEVSRWRPEDCVSSGSVGQGDCTRGSFLDSIDQFDPGFFGISALEATHMDPQQRLFLEESWRALEDAGYAGKSVQEIQCGIYVGCGSSGYDRLSTGDVPPQAFWGNSASVTPARIAYSLNLQGPAIAVDTACSSSLVAIHLACQGLWSRETEMALAGGVFVQATPGFQQLVNRAGMLSPDGKCYSFDARANGFVPGEGVGVVVLKRLRDALADGDFIHGVIAGSAINQNGRSNGLIAPNGRAQERLERSVYERFKIDPATIQVVEAHGTGTLLGDSVEYGALSRAFRGFTEKRQFCALGTVKTNIGHASTAAGVAGVLKLLLSLKHRRIPPSLHFEKGNPAIDFDSGPFYVNTRLKDWNVEGEDVRRAAVSSFGFGGTNAHLIVEEAPAVVRTEDEAAAYLIVLSARSGGQLKQRVLDLIAHLERTPDLAMTDLSFSLFAGRMHFRHRLACVARNREEVIRLLRQWIESGVVGSVYAAEVQEGRMREHVALPKLGTSPADYLQSLAAIAGLYVQGWSLDFDPLFPDGAKRVPLPAYPFARERYWVDAVRVDAVSDATPRPPAPDVARLHPLLHTNTSTFGQQSYGCNLAGTELFLRDQPAANGPAAPKVVSEAAYLEMARAAIENAAGIPSGSSVIELQDVVWADPLAVDRHAQMTIALSAGDDERVDFEIYSGDAEGEVVHCQGRASVRERASRAAVDLEELRRQMTEEPVDRYNQWLGLAAQRQQDDGAHVTLRALYVGQERFLAHLSMTASEAGDGDGGYSLHPTLMSGALQAASWLLASRESGFGTASFPRAVERVRIVSPCTEDVLVWARFAQGASPEGESLELDVDLLDPHGNLRVQMRRLSFGAEETAAEVVHQRTWLFSKEQVSGEAGSMGAVHKMTLFLRQEIALQLRKRMEEIPTDLSFFDLGLTSLGMTHVIQNTCRLLDESLSPSVLFDYRDIESLAAYLAMTYPSRIDAVTAVRGEDRVDPEVRLQIRAPRAAALPRRRRTSGALVRTPAEQTIAAAASEVDVRIERILETVSLQEESLLDGYEKVTF